MKRSRAVAGGMRLARLLIGASLLLGAAACAAKDPLRKPRSHDSWWGPESDSNDRSFFYGSFSDDGRR